MVNDMFHKVALKAPLAFSEIKFYKKTFSIVLVAMFFVESYLKL